MSKEKHFKIKVHLKHTIGINCEQHGSENLALRALSSKQSFKRTLFKFFKVALLLANHIDSAMIVKWTNSADNNLVKLKKTALVCFCLLT